MTQQDEKHQIDITSYRPCTKYYTNIVTIVKKMSTKKSVWISMYEMKIKLCWAHGEVQCRDEPLPQIFLLWTPSGIMMAGRAAAPSLRGHMHLEGLESRHCALNYSRSAMWGYGLPMLYEEHVMVVVQLVMHLFLQACFIPNFKHGMSEKIIFFRKM